MRRLELGRRPREEEVQRDAAGDDVADGRRRRHVGRRLEQQRPERAQHPVRAAQFAGPLAQTADGRLHLAKKKRPIKTR